MKPWTFSSALLLLPVAAFAQGEGEGQPQTPAEADPPVIQNQTDVPPVHEQPPVLRAALKLDPEKDLPVVNSTARHFFAALALGEPRQLAELSALPFFLEDKRLNSEEELITSWQKALRAKNTNSMTLYGLEILTAQQMEKKYGKPPARLASFPWKRAGTYTVIANVNGHAVVAVFLKTLDGFTAIAYHD